MAIIKSDIIIIPITERLQIAVGFIMEKQLLFGHNKADYTLQENKRFIEELKDSTLVEYAFLEYITQRLSDGYSYLHPEDRYKELKKFGFEYSKKIGTEEQGFYFTIHKKKVKIKKIRSSNISLTDTFNELEHQSELSDQLALLIEKSEESDAEIFIQAFIFDNDVIALSGFHSEKLNDDHEKNNSIIPLHKLNPIDDLIFKNEIFY